MGRCKWLVWIWQLTIAFELTWNINHAQEILGKCPDQCKCTLQNGNIDGVNCTNVKPIEDNLQLDLPKTVRHLTYSGHLVTNLTLDFIKQCTIGESVLPSLRFLDLSRNDINRIDGNLFGCFPNLETLLLNRNRLYFDKSTRSMFYLLKNLKELHLQNSFERRSDSTKFNNNTWRNDSTFHGTEIQWIFNNTILPSLQTLHLEYNKLLYINTSALCRPLPQLEKLYLSHNYITLTYMDISCFSHLKFLYVDDNSVAWLPDPLISQLNKETITFIDLRDNRWLCDCQFHGTLEWLQSEKGQSMANASQLWCYVEQKRRKIIDLRSSDLVCDDVISLDKRLKNSYIVLGCVFAAIGIMFLIVLFLNRDKIFRFGKRCFDPFINYNPNTPRGNYSSVAL